MYIGTVKTPIELEGIVVLATLASGARFWRNM